MSINRDAIAAAAMQYHGVSETHGSNRSPQIDAMVQAAGGVPGQPWCAAAASSVYGQSVPGAVDPTMSSRSMMQDFRADGAFVGPGVMPQVGDAAFFSRGLNAALGHTGVVTAVDPQTRTFTSMEGNVGGGEMRPITHSIDDGNYLGSGNIEAKAARSGGGNLQGQSVDMASLGSFSPSSGGAASRSSGGLTHGWF